MNKYFTGLKILIRFQIKNNFYPSVFDDVNKDKNNGKSLIQCKIQNGATSYFSHSILQFSKILYLVLL